jgi:hypothetical protein
MKILLNLIGMSIYFINRYANRADKVPSFSFSFWFKDNWPEVTTTILLDIALMILIFSPGTEISFDALFSKLPFGIKIAGDLLMSFLLGLGLSSLFYAIFKKKVRDAAKI